ncbi:ABC transporter ATP-binding protein [Clostridium sp. AM58-1XD]|uniref:ABC transporter ATP-binding protein n=1 Tax=Clostridium sp. AM58-1XD TaxID=2292307 RepID=UPI000E4CCB24|nr:ABC transporter ATP-binding protein [Clostridium sp. AM58-1XD]RGY99956.1 ABC transporter ATP-binding protein [Clostridium sp. AM58-1XD]
MAAIIKLEHVTKRFGGLKAVSDFSGEVEEGTIVGLIGPNGAGKTTLFNMMANTFHPTEGKITYLGEDISNQKTEKMAHIGLARTFQVTKPFGEMTLIENIMVGSFLHTSHVGEAERLAEEVYRFVGVSAEKDMRQRADSATTVTLKKLEIARALATKPKLLLLDEVMAGCNPQEKLELVEVCRRIRNSGVTILIIEHDIKTIMSLCDKIFVLNYGEKLMEGTPDEVGNDKRAISAYLGEDFANA